MKKNKTVLITGASAGMGKETARLLVSKGYTVYGAARRMDKMKDLELLGVKTISMDITNEASVTSGVNEIISIEGRIDILINNAGFGAYGAIEDVSMEDAKYQLNVNLFGAARLIQLVLPSMRKNNWGKIINISSIGGKLAAPYGGWYHASKFALEALSDALRNEVKQFGIDVIVIEPGGVKSEWGEIALENMEKNSANSAYSKSVKKVAAFAKKANVKNVEPSVIAGLILEGIETKNPKFRYIGGYMATQAIWARRLLSDKLFDKVLLGPIK
jgi:short-subunit dehydrogenase